MKFWIPMRKNSKEFPILMAIKEKRVKKNTSSQGQACRIHLTLRNKTCEHVRTWPTLEHSRNLLKQKSFGLVDDQFSPEYSPIEKETWIANVFTVNWI